MAETVEAEQTEAASQEAGAGRVRYGATIIIGHALKHFYISSLISVLLPEIKTTLLLSDTQIGTLASAQQFSGWFATVTAGYLGDRFIHKTALLLGLSLGLIGAAYFLLGISDTYLLLLVGMLIMGTGVSIFHPPAIGALSRRFADRRAFAISMHGAGGSVGEVLGPVTAAGLVSLLYWRDIMRIGTLPAVIAAFAMWFLLQEKRKSANDGSGASFREYFGSLLGLLRHRGVQLIFLATSLRTAGQAMTNVFLPIYLHDDLGYSIGLVGIYISMAQLAGIGSQPLMGFLTDRVGHKRVLVPALLMMASLLVLVPATGGNKVELALVVLGLGAFLFSLHAILISAATELAGEEMQSTTVSLVYAAGFLGSLAPTAAGIVSDAYGTGTIFVVAGALVVVAALVLSQAPLRRGQRAA